MDRLDAMRVVLAVVDAESLSAGSRKLNAPLPSVSRKVADLERYLGANLIIRTSRNLQLTDVGRDETPKPDKSKAWRAGVLPSMQT
ncbi:LysR family transcriptional regulator protein (plasmid) [Rhizobium gallicum bv. gallicum R602sp]|uniref:LysR family transcriptional regulator protein n=1 Tax=Rhizobium gallicum bv. gallicum R602sp TaxID=1041138 RepID=A0A0B4XBZ6_9HYPH|nr:LysR family transcriptional regulator protein [Rhizobium gallicum bv. gallicum R602sp]TDW25677.1 regulatory helix-turn-helix LysR family protein [Rhizobium azibense]